jgi:competence protein ComEC
MLSAFFGRFYAALQAQRERWVFWLPVPMAAGIGFYFSMRFEPWVGLGSLLAVAFAIVCYVARHNRWFLPLLVIFLFAFGFAAAQWRTFHVAAPVLDRETSPLSIEGRVVELDPLPGSDRIIIDQIKVLDGRRLPSVVPEKVRLRLKKTTQQLPRAGDIVSVRAVLLPLSPPVAPGAFDFQRHAFFKGLGATGYAVGDLNVVTPSSHGFFFEGLRHAIRQKIEAVIADHDTAAVTTALLIGETNNITEETWEAVRISGIAHIISISGFHITLIVGFTFFALRALLVAVPFVALNWPVKKLTAFICILVSVFYLLLIGTPVPALRAVVMATIVMIAIMLDRDPFTQRLAAFAAIFVLLIAPEALTGPSFQLSFAAVIALIAAFEAGRGILSSSFHRDEPVWVFRLARGLALAFAASIVTTLIASAATAPFALYHFGRMPSWAGVAANTVAVPLSSFVIMPFGFLACLLMPFGLEKIPLAVAGAGVDWMLTIAREVSAWPNAQITTASWPLFSLICASLGGLWVCFWRGRIRWLGFLCLLPACIAALLQSRPDVLVSTDADLVAFRTGEDVLSFSSLRSERFVREKWMEREGISTVLSWSEDDDGKKDISCDSSACRWNKDGQMISFAYKPEVFFEECPEASVVISASHLPRDLTECKKDILVIDRAYLRRSGPLSVYLQPEDAVPVVRSVNQERGRRPWTGAAQKNTTRSRVGDRYP